MTVCFVRWNDWLGVIYGFLQLCIESSTKLWIYTSHDFPKFTPFLNPAWITFQYIHDIFHVRCLFMKCPQFGAKVIRVRCRYAAGR